MYKWFVGNERNLKTLTRVLYNIEIVSIASNELNILSMKFIQSSPVQFVLNSFKIKSDFDRF